MTVFVYCNNKKIHLDLIFSDTSMYYKLSKVFRIKTVNSEDINI